MMKIKKQEDFNWHKIAEDLREQRFDNITDDLWMKIADRIDDAPKKRGPKPKTGLFSNCATRSFDQFCLATRKYDDYLEKGLSSSEATNAVARDMCLGIKSIEAYLTCYRKGRAESDRIENELIIECFKYYYDKIEDHLQLLITIREEAHVNASVQYIATVIDGAIATGEITFPK